MVVQLGGGQVKLAGMVTPVGRLMVARSDEALLGGQVKFAGSVKPVGRLMVAAEQGVVMVMVVAVTGGHTKLVPLLGSEKFAGRDASNWHVPYWMLVGTREMLALVGVVMFSFVQPAD